MPSINGINNTISNANFTVPAGTITASGNITSSAGYVVGATGLGAGANPGTSGLVVNLPNRIGAWITGPNVSSAGVDADGLFIDTSFEPTMSIGKAASIGLYPTFNVPGGVTITNGYGLYIASGTWSGIGVTTGYGLFVTHPTFGTSNYAAQIDNIRIDANTIEAANTNGSLDVNSNGSGALNLGTNASAHTVTLGSTNTTSTTNLQSGSGGINIPAFTEGALITSSTGGVSTVTGTAGYILTANAAGTSPSFQANTGTTVVVYTPVVFADSPYTVLSTDYYISVDVTGGAVSIRLPNTTTTARTFVIKDKVGLSATSNITVTTVGGAVNIDGATTFVMNTNYESIQLIWNGTSYEIY